MLYFQTLSGEIWRSFANSLRSILTLRSTVHEIARQFNNLAYSSGLMFVWPGHFCKCFWSLFSSNRLSKRTELYWNSYRQRRIRGGTTIGAIAPPKTEESNLIHHNFVQFWKPNSPYEGSSSSIVLS